jgi:glycine/D-amino acid oxidase-like deaminating enzyme
MAEIRVFGAGIFGLSIAWEATRRGARVEVVDPFGVAAGSSGGVVGALAPHVPENWNPKKQIQFESLEMAEDFWAEVAAVGGTDPGYALSGRLQPILDAAGLALARARAVTAADLWGDRYHWRVVDQGEFPGLLAPSPTGYLIYDTLSARLHPRRACAALADAIRARGGQVVTAPSQTPAVEVWATGAAGLADLSNALGRAAGAAVKGQAALLRADLARAPQLFAEALHIVPHADGTVAIGSTSERDYDDPSGTDAGLDALIDLARHHCPVLQDAPVIERWAGLRPRARSRAPMLGAHPIRQDAFIANGGFKIGFGMAPIVARLMADLILDGRDAIPDSFLVEASL